MSCIYGPHQYGTEDQGWVAHFLLSALRGDPITVYGDGHQTRDLLYAGDLVEALIAASQSESALSGRVFNMGGGVGNAASVNEVIEMIRALLDEPVDILWDAWRVADQRYYVSDTSAFTELTGWRPRVSIEAGLARLATWLTRARDERPQRPLATATAAAAPTGAGRA
jgi:CDP-paratose 2-epimerase